MINPPPRVEQIRRALAMPGAGSYSQSPPSGPGRAVDHHCFGSVAGFAHDVEPALRDLPDERQGLALKSTAGMISTAAAAQDRSGGWSSMQP